MTFIKDKWRSGREPSISGESTSSTTRYLRWKGNSGRREAGRWLGGLDRGPPSKRKSRSLSQTIHPSVIGQFLQGWNVFHRFDLQTKPWWNPKKGKTWVLTTSIKKWIAVAPFCWKAVVLALISLQTLLLRAHAWYDTKGKCITCWKTTVTDSASWQALQWLRV